MSESASPISSHDDLVRYFHDAETPRADWRVGTEHEKIGLLADTHERVPYEGERGIEALLSEIREKDGWESIEEQGRLIGLRKNGASITLEPGGQIELSGAPLRETRETCAEFNTHVDLVNELSEKLGIAFLALGADPLHTPAEIPKMPKARYDIMRAYLPSRGEMALDMMHATATVQANFDYESEADMATKLRTAMGCTPIVSALFANSPIAGGRESGFVSRRVEIWRHMDPDRCGLLPFVFEPDFGYRDYAEWALDVPMFFVVRDHAYHAANGTTFRQFVADGFQGHTATIDDWDLHLTTLFPEVRLKRFIEVRGADTVPRELICALPALWKGIFHSPAALEAAWQLVAGWSMDEREAALSAAARGGLSAQLGGRPALELARELCAIATQGLREVAEAGESEMDERRFLEPVNEQLEIGMSPGEVVLDRWRGEWNGSVDRLVEYSRY